MSTRPRLILFPGLGCDERLLEPQRDIDAEVLTPRWLPPRRRESLADYGARMAAALPVDQNKPLFVGGISFGGMVAQEIARHLPVDGVVLISSCRGGHGIPTRFRRFARTLLPVLPPGAVKQVRNIPMLLRKVTGRNAHPDFRWLDPILHDGCPHMLTWSVRAILDWPGRPGDLGVPLIHVKGDQDDVLPHTLCPPTHLIRGAGHLMNRTHAAVVNALINDHLSRATRGRSRLARAACETCDPCSVQE